MTQYVIGDIHGCFQSLQTLLSHIDFEPQQDTLWFTGDLVNRGPQSLAVLEFIEALPQRHITLGNHDLHLLAVAAQVRAPGPQDTLQEVLQSPRCRFLCDWLREQPVMHRRGNRIWAHAGLPPHWSIATIEQRALEVAHGLRQRDYHRRLALFDLKQHQAWDDQLDDQAGWQVLLAYFTYMRACTADGHMDHRHKGDPREQPDTSPWFTAFHARHPEIEVYFGHWSALNGHTGIGQIHALDTGCVWGRHLTAYCLDSGQRFQVPSQE